jgi:hypothetical protein
MNKNIKKNILIQSTKSYDKSNDSKELPNPKYKFNEFLKDFLNQKNTYNLRRYVDNIKDGNKSI